jgi:hypothetical protein
MPGVSGSRDGQVQELYAQARAARAQSRVLAGRLEAARRRTAETLTVLEDVVARAKQIRELWLSAQPRADGLRYSASARLQARLADLPVIEQAKGITMAQYGWREDTAFDALRWASHQENATVRDIASKIVTEVARSVSGQPPGGLLLSGGAPAVKLPPGPWRLSRLLPRETVVAKQPARPQSGLVARSTRTWPPPIRPGLARGTAARTGAPRGNGSS